MLSCCFFAMDGITCSEGNSGIDLMCEIKQYRRSMFNIFLNRLTLNHFRNWKKLCLFCLYDQFRLSSVVTLMRRPVLMYNLHFYLTTGPPCPSAPVQEPGRGRDKNYNKDRAREQGSGEISRHFIIRTGRRLRDEVWGRRLGWVGWGGRYRFLFDLTTSSS